MTARVDWPEYHRRLAIRQARRAHVETEAGYTAAPIRLWQFDGGGEGDSGGQRVASNPRNFTVRGRR